MMNYEKQVQAIVGYLRDGETKRENFKIGMELEQFFIHKDSLKTVSYGEENGVESTLLELSEKYGLRGKKEGNHILELHGKDFTFTTEPGGQFELSLSPKGTIEEIESEYIEKMQKVASILKEKDQWIVNLGYHPLTKIGEIPLLPKERYQYMYEYFKTRGSFAHHMMKGTCALQVSIDYADEEDFKEKYRLLSAMSPIFYTLFDNSPYFEGKLYEKHNLRQKIWEETDRVRTGIIPNAFEENFGYEAYAKWLLELPPIFLEDKGKFVGEGRPFRQVLEESMGKEVLFHMLSIVFPDIRAKSYLEIRMMDSLPYPLNIGVIALIKGLFLDKENVMALLKEFRNLGFSQVQKGKEEAEKYGMKGLYLGKTMEEHGRFLLDMAYHSLNEKECSYLKPIAQLLELGMSPKEKFLALEKKEGVSKAIEKVAFQL